MMEETCCKDDENRRGLQHLSQNVTLRNFTNMQWKELAELLGLVDTGSENTSQNTTTTTTTTTTTATPLVDYNRGREDGQIALDLQHIIG